MVLENTCMIPLQVWSFSKVADNIRGWVYADTPSLCAHMSMCEVHKSHQTIWRESYGKQLKMKLHGLAIKSGRH